MRSASRHHSHLRCRLTTSDRQVIRDSQFEIFPPMERAPQTSSFRPKLVGDRTVLSFPSSMGKTLCRRGLCLSFFVKSPLARVAIVADKAAAQKKPTVTSAAAIDNQNANILMAIAAGEPRAMNRCIDAHGPLVWGIIKRYLKNATEAEDLVQEIFTEIWKKAAAFDPAISSESNFVGMIARRRAIDTLRRLGRQPGFETLDAVESQSHTPWQGSISLRDPEAVRSSLASLPADTRELFNLFFDNGLTHPEIAEKTGLPLGTIKTRLRRGLMALRELLQRNGKSNSSTSS